MFAVSLSQFPAEDRISRPVPGQPKLQRRWHVLSGDPKYLIFFVAQEIKTGSAPEISPIF